MTIKVAIATGTQAGTDRWLSVFTSGYPQLEVFAWDGQSDVVADYAVVWKPPAAFFTHARGLKAIFNLGAGVDALLKLPELPVDVPVVRLEDAGMAQQMAEYVVHGIIHVARQFDEYGQLQARGQWQGLPAIDYAQWPVGVLGLGAIGSKVAQTVAALGYPVSGWSRSPRTVDGVTTYHGADGFDACLKASRVLVNVLPLTPDTENLLRRDTLKMLHPDAYVINVARGEHLVLDDLLALIDEGHVRGALLDAFRTEPLPADDPLWKHPKIRITPHVAAITLDRQAGEQIVGKMMAFDNGDEISGIVPRDRGY